MALLDDAVQQARVLTAYGAMLSGRPERIADASRTLREAGPAARWCLLKLAQQRENAPARTEACVLLHALNETRGLEALQEMLRWGQNVRGDRDNLTHALVRIGAPDAIDATLAVWPALVQSGDACAQRTVCRAWAELRDPRALDALVATCEQIPAVFGETAASFGEPALPALERLLNDPWALRRHLAVEAIGLIPCQRSFRLLSDRLLDSDPDLRQHAAAALGAGFGPKLLAPVLAEAVLGGYSSPQAVSLLVRFQPPDLLACLIAILARWDPQRPPAGDAEESVQAALGGIVGLDNDAVPDPAALIHTLAALQSRRPGPLLTPPIALALAKRAAARDAGAVAVAALVELLTETDAETRKTAAEGLERAGEPLGSRFLAVLESCRPSGDVMGSIQLLLRGGPEANLAARDTVRQLGRWVSRISQVAAQRLSPEAVGVTETRDPRISDLLRRLLIRGLESWEMREARSPAARSGPPPAETMERVWLCVSAARGLGGDTGACDPDTQAALVQALRFVRMGAVYEEGGAGPLRHSDWREIGGPIRAAASDALLARLGAIAYPLLIETMYDVRTEARASAITGLGRLGDRRALSHLEPIAGQPEHPLNATAVEAVAAIRRTHPEMMVLLRPSDRASAGELLRPAAGVNHEIAAHELLRPLETDPGRDGVS
jgi:HEAT repeat protein